MLMPHVVHDQASGQRQRQFRERGHPWMGGRGDEGGHLGGGRGSRLLGRAGRLPRVRVVEQSFPCPPVEHRLHVLPRVHHLVRRVAGQFHVAPPRVEVGRVRLHVLVRRADPVRVEDELVRREEEAAVGALYALGPGAVVTRRKERASATPRALVVHREREVLG